MEKLDLKKRWKELYNPSAKEVVLVDVPEMKFLMTDGEGDPNKAPEFQRAIEALYGTAYTIKFTLKKAGVGPEYSVMPLEGLWWTDDMPQFSMDNKGLWKWTLMTVQPEHITEDHVQRAVQALTEKRGLETPPDVRLESFSEGLSAQILHVGPYSAEGPTIERIQSFIKDKGYKLRGKHHEIYLGDPRRTAPEKLKTVLRQPVSPG